MKWYHPYLYAECFLLGVIGGWDACVGVTILLAAAFAHDFLELREKLRELDEYYRLEDEP